MTEDLVERSQPAVGIHINQYNGAFYRAHNPETKAHDIDAARQEIAWEYVIPIEEFWRLHPEQAPQISKDTLVHELQELVLVGMEESFKLARFKDGAREALANSIRYADSTILDTVGNVPQQEKKFTYLNPRDQAVAQLVEDGLTKEEATRLVAYKFDVHIHPANKHEVIREEVKRFKEQGYAAVIVPDDIWDNITRVQEIGRETKVEGDNGFEVFDYFINNKKPELGGIKKFNEFMMKKIREIHEAGGKVAVIFDWDDTLYDEQGRNELAHKITEKLINEKYAIIASSNASI